MSEVTGRDRVWRGEVCAECGCEMRSKARSIECCRQVRCRSVCDECRLVSEERAWVRAEYIVV